MSNTQANEVSVDRTPLRIPTYPLPDPSPHPMFFEKRVYQGSSGKVYPLRFHERVSDSPTDTAWDAVTLENEYVRLEVLPELGGRIHRGLDKTINYDFFYHQHVIKPALVGLAGPWISGGVEFNWPQHHRPSTYLPVDTHVERHSDGAATVWQSEHDPMHRMKGMHGITLRPGSSRVELHARLYNRTPFTRTFLWWANVAACVHDAYQSFFPPDVQFVADHAVRAMSSFPIARNHYYGIDYRPGTDLTWYSNIPVPTSYMVMRTEDDFFGGFDHRAGGGFVHVADRFISPGKKQWTWGNAEFGRAWDRELTDPHEHGEYRPYIELMAGVYTDNQPDFSYLQPYETKTFRQCWWPIQGIGVAHRADEHHALHLSLAEGQARVAAAAAEPMNDVTLELDFGDGRVEAVRGRLGPGEPLTARFPDADGRPPSAYLLTLRVDGKPALSYRPPLDEPVTIPPTATEPPSPDRISSADELYLVGEHLDQYRHPTRRPEPYWRQALQHDPDDARCNLAMGRRLLDRGLVAEAEEHLRRAVARYTVKHPNPVDGEPWYLLGLCHERRGDDHGARAWHAKATWNRAWRAPAHLRLGLIALRAGRPAEAIDQFDEASRHDARLQHAATYAAHAHRALHRLDEAEARLVAVLKDDPLDHFAAFELARTYEAMGLVDRARDANAAWREQTRRAEQTLLDVAFDYVEAAAFDEATAALEFAEPAGPMVHLTLAWLHERSECQAESAACLGRTRNAKLLDLFPSRPQEEAVLVWAVNAAPDDATSPYLLGVMLQDRGRYDEAIQRWQTAVDRDPTYAAAHRCLGIALFNHWRDDDAAAQAFAKAFAAAPDDGRVLFELDQLDRLRRVPPERRLDRLTSHEVLVADRDDLRIEVATLYNLLGEHEAALRILTSGSFHPWEGGEGKVLAQHVAAYLGLGRQLLQAGDASAARDRFQAALDTPPGLGEARHPLASTADIDYELGRAHRALGEEHEANARFRAAASASSDFADMAVLEHSAMSYFKAMALVELGDAVSAGVADGDAWRAQTHPQRQRQRVHCDSRA